MLTATSASSFTARCDKCGAELVVESSDRDGAERDLQKRGWLDVPKKGRGREKWDWWCPSCAPRRGGPPPMGPTTPPMPTSKG